MYNITQKNAIAATSCIPVVCLVHFLSRLGVYSPPYYTYLGFVIDMARAEQCCVGSSHTTKYGLTLLEPHSHKWGQNTQITSSLSPRRDWGPKRANDSLYIAVNVKSASSLKAFITLVRRGTRRALWSSAAGSQRPLCPVHGSDGT